MGKLRERMNKRIVFLIASLVWLAGTISLIIYYSNFWVWYNTTIPDILFGIGSADNVLLWIIIMLLFYSFLVLLACAILVKVPGKTIWSSYPALILYGVIGACLVALIIQHYPLFIVGSDSQGFITVYSVYDPTKRIDELLAYAETDRFLWSIFLLLLFWNVLLLWYLDAWKGIEIAFNSLFAAFSFLFIDPPQTTKIAEPEQGLVKDEELLSLKQDVQNNPQSYEAWTELGYRQHELGQDDEALASANKALEILSTRKDLAHGARDKAYARAWTVRGAALSTMEGKEVDALAACEEALAYEPNNLEALFYKAMIFNFQEHDNLAHRTYDRILQLDPTYKPALLSKAALYLATDDFDEALVIAEKFISRFPEDAAGWRLQGMVYELKGGRVGTEGRLEEGYQLLDMALASFNKALEIDPLDPTTYRLKAAPYAAIGEYGKALDTLDQGLKLDPNDKELQEAKTMIVQTRNNEMTHKIAGTAGRFALRGGVGLAKGSVDIAKLFFNDVFRKS